jgi:hypothetical protein
MERFLFVQMFKYKRVKIELHSIILFECTHSENSAQNLHRIHYTDIFDTALFCKENIKSFLLSGLRTIRDVLAEEILNVKDSIHIYNSFFDKSNCISEYSQIKAAMPNTFVSVLKINWKICSEIKLVDISLLSDCNKFY